MRKITLVLLTFVLGTTILVGCENNKQETVKETQKQEQSQEQTQEKKDESKEVKNSTSEMKLQTPFEVKTEYGDYTLTINSVRRTDERNEFEEEQPKQVILIDYEYKNDSFKGSDGNQKLYIDQFAFVVMDEEGNVLRSYPVSMDKLPQQIPVGGKCNATIGYGVPTDSKTIRLQFERNNSPIGEMVVEIQ